jgi:hypothetical protein
LAGGYAALGVRLAANVPVAGAAALVSPGGGGAWKRLSVAAICPW